MEFASRSEIAYLNDAICQAIDHDFYQILRVIELHYSDCSLLNNGFNKLPLSLLPATEISFPATDIRAITIEAGNSHALTNDASVLQATENDKNNKVKLNIFANDNDAIENDSFDINCTDMISRNNIELQLNFMGLYGVASSLPHYWMEHALRTDCTGKTIRAFLNIFNQRIYTLLYLAWKKHQAMVQIEQGEKGYQHYLQAISGQTLNSTDTIEFAYAGILGQRVHNATTLATLLSHYLENIHVNVQQHIPRWIKIENCARLRVDDSTQRQNDVSEHLQNDVKTIIRNDVTASPRTAVGLGIRLGDNALLGTRILDINSKIIITIGPIAFATALTLLTDQFTKQSLVHLIRRYCGLFYVFTIRLNVILDNVSSLILGRDNIRLGWLSCLGCSSNKTQFINLHF